MADNKAVAKNDAAKTKKPDGSKKPSLFSRVKGFFGRIVKYFKDTKSELKKVVWPSAKQTRTNTITVIVVVLIAAVFMILLDLVFGGVINLMISGTFFG